MKGLTSFPAGKRRDAETAFQNFVNVECGASAVEYSLLVALIATAIIAVAKVLGGQLIPGFQLVIGGL